MFLLLFCYESICYCSSGSVAYSLYLDYISSGNKGVGVLYRSKEKKNLKKRKKKKKHLGVLRQCLTWLCLSHPFNKLYVIVFIHFNRVVFFNILHKKDITVGIMPHIIPRDTHRPRYLFC